MNDMDYFMAKMNYFKTQAVKEVKGVFMEEKNRYIYTKIDGYYWIKDTETNENYCVDKKIVNLLNQQDKEIKTLKTKFEDRKRFCISQVKCQQDLINKLLEENQ